MNPKIIIIATVAMALISLSAAAMVIEKFQDWEQVKNNSSDIVIATAWDENPSHGVLVNRKADFQIEILSVLKGTNVTGFVRLLADHELERGQEYLIFGIYSGTYLDAGEDYRVIPLGKSFRLQSLKDKTEDEKFQILFQSGVEYMNQRIQDDQAVKDRLEQALQK